MNTDWSQIKAIFYLHFLKTRSDSLVAILIFFILGVVYAAGIDTTSTLKYIILVFCNFFVLNEYFLTMTSALVNDRLNKTRFLLKILEMAGLRGWKGNIYEGRRNGIFQGLIIAVLDKFHVDYIIFVFRKKIGIQGNIFYV